MYIEEKTSAGNEMEESKICVAIATFSSCFCGFELNFM